MRNHAACTAYLRQGLVFAASRSREPGPAHGQDPQGTNGVACVVFSSTI